MSLESQIENLTTAVENLAFIIKQLNVMHQAAPIVAAVPVMAPAPIPTPTPAPIPTPPVVIPVSNLVMPEPPSFLQIPPVVVTHPKAPFSTPEEVKQYLIGKFNKLGASRGNDIQKVILSLGCQGLNDIKSEQYDALFSAVEAL